MLPATPLKHHPVNEQFHTKCLISGSSRLKPLKGYEQHYLVKSYPLGFVFASKVPTEEELVAHYKKYSREDYLSPITVKRYHELLDQFEKYRKTGRILDVGCGIGYFLNEAKKRGWEVYGTEFTDEAIAKCHIHGINMHKGKLDPAWFEEGMFDVITSFEVIEHINNPVEEVQNINKILRTGGLFYFTTPNFNAIERYVLKADYNVITYPEHLCYYTRKTIDYLLRNHGFKKKKLLTTGFSMSRIKTSMGSKKEVLHDPSSSDEKIRDTLEKNKLMHLVKHGVNTALTLLGVGSSLKGWYIKTKSV